MIPLIPDEAYLSLGGSIAAALAIAVILMILVREHRSKTVEKFDSFSNRLMDRVKQLDARQESLERERELDRRWIELLCAHINAGSPPPPPARPSGKDS